MITPIRTSRFLLAPVSSRYVLETSVSRVDILARQLGFQEHSFVLVIQQNYAGNHTIAGWPANVSFINEQSGPDLAPGSQTVYQFFTQDCGKNWVVEVNGISRSSLSASSIAVDTTQLINVTGESLPEVIASIDGQLSSSEQVLYKLDNGAITLQIPDDSDENGVNRGVHAVDLQVNRSTASNVAQGDYSFVVGENNVAYGPHSITLGKSNTCSGSSSIAIGESNSSSGYGVALGYNNSALGYCFSLGAYNSTNGLGSVAIGYKNSAYHPFSWIPGGSYAVINDLYGGHAWSSAKRAVDGDNQHAGCVVQATTIDATPLVLTTDREYPYYNWDEAYISNVFMLNNNSMYTGYIKVGVQEEVPTINADGSPGTLYRRVASWLFDVTVVRGASATNTLLVNSTLLNSTRFFMPEAVVAQVAVNTSKGSIEVRATGLSGVTLHWIAEFMGVMTTA